MSEEKKTATFSNDDFFLDAINAWCAEFKPAFLDDFSDKINMYDILDALNSFYGNVGAFDGQEVMTELKKRGYCTIFDPPSNQFMIVYKN
jgi:hypothetical protein